MDEPLAASPTDAARLLAPGEPELEPLLELPLVDLAAGQVRKAEELNRIHGGCSFREGLYRPGRAVSCGEQPWPAEPYRSCDCLELI